MAASGEPLRGLRIFRQIRRPDQAALARLAEVGVGDISDAMRGMGVMDGGITQVYTPMRRVFGPALTVDLSPGNGLMLRAAATTAQPGDIIVANAHGETQRAVLGGTVGMHMVHRGIKGLVIDGGVRDVREFQALDFAVMARAVTPRSGTSGAGWGEVNVPVACGGVVVNPGDLVVGDNEGIVVVPRLWVEAVAEALGRTGHGPYQPETSRTRLREMKPDTPMTGADHVERALKERGGIVVDDVYTEDAPPPK